MSTLSNKLFSAFKSAGKKGLTDKDVLEIVPNVGYVTHLERAFGCKFDRVKEGRRIVSFVLTNASSVNVPEGGKTAKVAKTKKVKPVAKTKTVVEKKVKVKPEREKLVAPDADLMISEVTDNELADIKSQLGLA